MGVAVGAVWALGINGAAINSIRSLADMTSDAVNKMNAINLFFISVYLEQ